VRSSKQDQHHNSIVSTLLALIDGVDELGQATALHRWSMQHATDDIQPITHAKMRRTIWRRQPCRLCTQAAHPLLRAAQLSSAQLSSAGYLEPPSSTEVLGVARRSLCCMRQGVMCGAQVVIIGATNRPDSIDPALRRPGRHTPPSPLSFALRSFTSARVPHAARGCALSAVMCAQPTPLTRC
jgi:hypothetical protein